jgi:FixJ family two-component response regulator
MSDRWVGRAQFLSSRLIQIKARWVRLETMRPSVVRLQPMIFIVDDDESVRDSLRLLLECAGFEVCVFGSCWEFLAADRIGEGDCLILDVHMTGMSGLDLLERMRGRGDRVPVILITGRLDMATRSRAQAAGALAVVEKPYKAGEILALVRRALGQENSPTASALFAQHRYC